MVTVPFGSARPTSTGRALRPGVVAWIDFSTWARSEPMQGLRAVDDHLRGVDLPVAAGLGIGLLARREGRMGQRVLPAEIIPVIHREGQGDDVGLAREIGQNRIGRRAGGAALAGEQLDHRAGRVRQGRLHEGGEAASAARDSFRRETMVPLMEHEIRPQGELTLP